VVVGHIMGNLIRLWQMFSVGAGKDAVRVELAYRRGLFQGDSLLLLLYCLSIASLSIALRSVRGYRLAYHNTVVSHLCFMDDVKGLPKTRSNWVAHC